MADAPSCFSSGNPALRVAWDSTSLDSFLRDPFSYYCQYVLGYQTTAPRPPLTFGRLVHAALEELDKAKLAGMPKEDATYWALDLALDWAVNPEPEDFPGWTLDDIAANGKRLDDKKRGRQALVRLITWYVEEFWDDDLYEPILLPDGRPAVEVSFAYPLGLKSPYGDDYLICGHLDGIVRHTGEGHLLVRERKHTVTTLGKYYFDNYRPNTQVNTYAAAGQLVMPETEVRGVLIEAAQSAVDFVRFDREWIRRSRALNDEWLDVVRYHIRRAEEIAERDEWALAHNPMGAQVYGGGPFRELVCKEPALRMQFLAANYERREPWNPLVVR